MGWSSSIRNRSTCRPRRRPPAGGYAGRQWWSGAAREAEHARLAGPVDVGIQDADLGALRGQGQREIHRGGRLADATLAGGDGDDVADPGQRLEAGLHRARLHVPLDVDLHPGHAGKPLQKLIEFGLQLPLVAVGGKAQPQRDTQRIAVQRHGGDGAGRDEILLDDRIDTPRQQLSGAV
jgi:hypothetical protein